MALSVYLALTAWEYQNCASPPEYPAWMACHFSSYGNALSNIPEHFPTGGILMVNDHIPPEDHDPQLIARQLLQAAEAFSPKGVILDFQRPYQENIRQIAQSILSLLPCPVAVTEAYCQDWAGAVFLPPVPLGQKPEDYLRKWQGKDIWLEVTKAGEQLTLTQDGCSRQPVNQLPGMPVFQDDALFCHYSTDVSEHKATFCLWQTDEDIARMLEKMQSLGVSTAVGLYQEFC